MMGTKITDKTLGLFGMGRIAQAMAQKAHFGFRMKLSFMILTLMTKKQLKNLMLKGVKVLMNFLVTQILFLFTRPSTKETKGIVNYETISK